MPSMNALVTRRRILAGGTALAATALLAACGSADEDVGNGQGNTDDPTATPTSPPGPQPTLVPNPIPYPTGENELVLRIELQGGFVPWAHTLTSVPNASLLGDGRLIVPGPQPEIYPPPALPNLLVTKLNSEGIQTILARAEALGLLDGDQNYNDLTSTIADAATTVFTVNAGGNTSTISVYALGLEGDVDVLTPERQELFEALSAFAEFVQSAPSTMPGSSIDEPEQPYEIERLQVVSGDPANEAAGDPEVGSQELDWPLDTPLTELGEPYTLPDTRCFVVDGAELAVLLPVLETANSLTRWKSAEQLYVLYLRPLLPDEQGCGTVEAPAPGPAGYEHPTAPEELVLRIAVKDGFVPLEERAKSMPLVSLMGDGSLVTHGPQIMIYPPPALPSLAETGLNEDGIQAILAEADAAGLLSGDHTYDLLVIEDAPTTVFTVNANGETHTVSVTALDMGEDEVDITEEEREARRKLRDFMNLMAGPAGWLPTATIVEPEHPYVIERLQVTAQPEASTGPLYDGVGSGEAEWPLATPLAELGEPYFLEMSRCFEVSGAELALLLPMLQQTNTMTRWLSDGERYVLYPRPLMPDETACDNPFA